MKDLKSKLHTLLVGFAVGVAGLSTILLVMFLRGDLQNLLAAGGTSGASDVNAQYWNGKDLTDDVNPSGTWNFTGKVGIGTSSPQAGLQVGTGTPNYATATNELFVEGNVEADGNIHVGHQTVRGECPDGWVMVPGDPSLGTTDFCVMKYEAKSRDGVAKSMAANTPWVNITQTSAIAECKEVGAHLLTTREALTISRDIASVESNWNNGIGSCMYGGHMDNDPGNALAADTTGDSDDDPYVGTNDSSTDSFECPFDTSTGSGDGKEQRRTFTLSNREVIWDWSGNVWEWTVNTCTAGTGTGNWDGDAAWEEWTSSEFDDYERATMGPSSSSYDSSNGVGKYYGCTSNGNAFKRGGGWSDGSNAGAFTLSLNNAPSNSDDYIGFRCAR